MPLLVKEEDSKFSSCPESETGDVTLRPMSIVKSEICLNGHSGYIKNESIEANSGQNLRKSPSISGDSPTGSRRPDDAGFGMSLGNSSSTNNSLGSMSTSYDIFNKFSFVFPAPYTNGLVQNGSESATNALNGLSSSTSACQLPSLGNNVMSNTSKDKSAEVNCDAAMQDLSELLSTVHQLPPRKESGRSTVSSESTHRRHHSKSSTPAERSNHTHREDGDKFQSHRRRNYFQGENLKQRDEPKCSQANKNQWRSIKNSGHNEKAGSDGRAPRRYPNPSPHAKSNKNALRDDVDKVKSYRDGRYRMRQNSERRDEPKRSDSNKNQLRPGKSGSHTERTDTGERSHRRSSRSPRTKSSKSFDFDDKVESHHHRHRQHGQERSDSNNNQLRPGKGGSHTERTDTGDRSHRRYSRSPRTKSSKSFDYDDKVESHHHRHRQHGQNYRKTSETNSSMNKRQSRSRCKPPVRRKYWHTTSRNQPPQPSSSQIYREGFSSNSKPERMSCTHERMHPEFSAKKMVPNQEFGQTNQRTFFEEPTNCVDVAESIKLEFIRGILLSLQIDADFGAIKYFEDFKELNGKNFNYSFHQSYFGQCVVKFQLNGQMFEGSGAKVKAAICDAVRQIIPAQYYDQMLKYLYFPVKH